VILKIVFVNIIIGIYLCHLEFYSHHFTVSQVFAATAARFYWEISWQVQIEGCNEWYRGDFSTKMMFNFNATNSSFGMVSLVW
jgi:hypothetical protein